MFKVVLLLKCDDLRIATIDFRAGFAPFAGLVFELCNAKYASPFDRVQVQSVVYNLPGGEFVCTVVIADNELHRPSLKYDMQERGWEPHE